MARRSRRQPSRRTLMIRAPRKSTVIIASVFYIVGLFGVLGFFPIPEPYATTALAIAGGLLLLGSFLRDL